MSDNVHSLIGAYALDAVTAEERAEFEAHLPDCPDCAAEVSELMEAAGALGATAAAPAPESMRGAVLARVRQAGVAAAHIDGVESGAVSPLGAAGSPRSGDGVAGELASVRSGLSGGRAARRGRFGAWSVSVRFLATAAAVAVVGIAASVIAGAGASSPSNADLAREIMTVASAPDAHSMELDLGASHLVMSERMDALVVMGADAPMPADGMEYQLWLEMDDGSLVAGPTFAPDREGAVMAMMHGDGDMDHVTRIMVSEEPAGGSPAPTSAPLATVDL